MYKSIYYDRKTNFIHLWTDEPVEPYSCFQYKKYGYRRDYEGEYTTMTGVKVGKVFDWDKNDEMYEHDVRPTTRVLLDRYWQTDDVSTGHVILTFDIEVSKQKKHSTAQDAENPITAIAYHDNISKQYVCLLLDPDGKMYSKEIGHIQLQVFRTEEGLLSYFLKEWKRIRPNIVTGWNCAGYDIPYLYNRLCRILSRKVANTLSEVEIVDCGAYGGVYGANIAGVDCMDYLDLYKKFTYSEQSSYKLEAIAKLELGRGKIQHEGSLDDLYVNDLEKFIHYNVTDVELVVDLDTKLDFISIAQGICHKGHVSYADYLKSSYYLDGAALTYCKRNGMVAISNPNSKKDDGKAEGAFVKLPNPGIYEYIYFLDIVSMYPFNIMCLNISPETKCGKVDNWNEEAFVRREVNEIKFTTTGKPQYLSPTAFDKYLIDSKVCIASNGVMYRTDQPGLLSSILSMWFDERKEFSGLSDKYAATGDTEQATFYARKQLITKILLNSFYGVLLLPSFRFYDRDIGESVTLTGQSLIGFTAKMINLLQNKRFGTEGVDYVVYQDTDSAAVDVAAFVKPLGDVSDDERLNAIVEFASDITKQVNASYELYARRFHGLKSHRWEIKLELVASPGFWGSMKKRYALRIRWEKGKIMDKTKFKGYDVVRSSFPSMFRKFMGSALDAILHHDPADVLNVEVNKTKKLITTEPILNIMLPTGVKEISKYQYGQKGTPMHVKSAQNYNMMLDMLNIQSSPPIEDGDKILYTYLHPNPFNFDTIALVGYDDPPEIVDYVEKYIDRDSLFNRVLLTKLQSIWADLGWGVIPTKYNANDYF